MIVTSSEATERDIEEHKKLRTRAEDYLLKPYSIDAVSYTHLDVYKRQRPENVAAGSSAIAVPVQPPPSAGEVGPSLSKGPLVLFPKSLNGVVGGPAANAPIPKGPDRLFKDERLEEKKEPDFVLLADKDGGYKSETKNFIAHIKSDGSIDFETVSYTHLDVYKRQLFGLGKIRDAVLKSREAKYKN